MGKFNTIFTLRYIVKTNLKLIYVLLWMGGWVMFIYFFSIASKYS